jgi:transcriptional regulator with XRE-family HTH domain
MARIACQKGECRTASAKGPMLNGIEIFRLRKGISLAELARAIGTTRQQMGRLAKGERKLTTEWADKIAKVLDCRPQELLYPHLARVDYDRFQAVFDAPEPQDVLSEPTLALKHDFLERLLPPTKNHKLQLLFVDSDDLKDHVARGDAVIVDVDVKKPARAGIYVIKIGDINHWRLIAPRAGGQITVSADSGHISEEVVDADSLQIVGYARLRVTPL